MKHALIYPAPEYKGQPFSKAVSQDVANIHAPSLGNYISWDLPYIIIKNLLEQRLMYKSVHHSVTYIRKDWISLK